MSPRNLSCATYQHDRVHATVAQKNPFWCRQNYARPFAAAKGFRCRSCLMREAFGVQSSSVTIFFSRVAVVSSSHKTADKRKHNCGLSSPMFFILKSIRRMHPFKALLSNLKPQVSSDTRCKC